MSQATIERNSAAHPAFAGTLAAVEQAPVQLRRAEYVSRLIRMDWEYESADMHAAVVRGRAELAALKVAREELDADHALWKRHAPEWAWPEVPVRTFKDFAGECPVTVEWVHTMHGPRLLAVVVDLARDVKRIDQALSPEVMQRLNQLVWASANKRAVS